MTQHNTTQHNTTQHNTTQHNTTQHNTTQHNTTQHKGQGRAGQGRAGQGRAGQGRAGLHTLMSLSSPPPQTPAIWSSPALHTTRGQAPLALSCCTTLCILLQVLSWVASTIIGMCSSTSARGPCFISPARMPSLCMYTSSFTYCGRTAMIKLLHPQCTITTTESRIFESLDSADLRKNQDKALQSYKATLPACLSTQS